MDVPPRVDVVDTAALAPADTSPAEDALPSTFGQDQSAQPISVPISMPAAEVGAESPQEDVRPSSAVPPPIEAPVSAEDPVESLPGSDAGSVPVPPEVVPALGPEAPEGDLGDAATLGRPSLSSQAERTLEEMFGETDEPEVAAATPIDDPYDASRAGRGSRRTHGRSSAAADARSEDLADLDETTASDGDDGSSAEEETETGGDVQAAQKPWFVRAILAVKSAYRIVAGSVSRAWQKIPEGWRPLAKWAIGFVVVALVVTLVVPTIFGGDDAEPQEAGRAGGAVPEVVQSQSTGAAADGVLAVARGNVSADCANGSTHPHLAFSSASKDAWQCKRYFSSDGVTMEIRFDRPVTISQIQFTPGWNYTEPSVDNWTKWRVVKEVLWIVGEDQYAQSVTPTRAGVTQRFNPPVSTSVLKMVILQTEPASGAKQNGSLGGSWDETEDGFAISNLKIYGRESS
ncbi:hypothetical protein MUG78_17180 [Gordonia alkaliphila]|uniref:hypothetical protein n=1 Tax=Gordonia alkaliphila TaxID=1053547 RepID=UPI001FF5C489|nr:hypothetical protein [Gordonia alkaliphila]MCK0441135.1 hypothetical protein [Gordonia alkaliphila]